MKKRTKMTVEDDQEAFAREQELEEEEERFWRKVKKHD